MAVTETITESKKKSKTVLKTDDKPDKDLRNTLKTLKESIDQSWFEIAYKLPEVYDTEIFKTWGFNEFTEYLRVDLDIEYRTGMFYLHIGRVSKQLGLTSNDVKKVGWSKMRELSKLVGEDTTKAEFKDFIKKAEDMTYEEVTALVKSERSEKKTVTKKTKFTFTMTNEQSTVLEEALDTAKKLASTEDLDVALEYICIWFTLNQNPDDAKKVITELHESVASVSEKEKVKHKKHEVGGTKKEEVIETSIEEPTENLTKEKEIEKTKKVAKKTAKKAEKIKEEVIDDEDTFEL